jgi:hypothetical protein
MMGNAVSAKRKVAQGLGRLVCIIGSRPLAANSAPSATDLGGNTLVVEPFGVKTALGRFNQADDSHRSPARTEEDNYVR